ncbi:P-loop containing nucleoside triphosphate hydrolase [Sesbania bispinosa]|nr:P-loop containing nucleoside triphosphate hydrolase [Sesbania bispinosa]
MDTDSRFSICLPCQMLDILSFVRRVAPYAFGPILGEAGYLISYEGNLKELADHVKELEAKRGEINHLVEAETRNGKIIEPGVQNWLDKVNEVIEKANKLLEDSNHAEVGCSGWVFPNLISRHQFSKKASEIAKDVVQVRGKENFKGVCYLPPLDGAASSSGTRGDENLLETRETFKEEIVKALKDPKALNIGVYGLGGVGEIADRLGLQFGEKTVPGRASRLRQRIIKEEKTILVILDDIWTTLDLEEVGIPSGTGSDHDACKLLMTSRNEHVLLKMDAQKDFIFRLEALSGPETWSLFQNMAGDVVNDISFKDVAIQVAQKCGGLPLSVVTVARALKDRRIYAWKDALRQLQSVDLDHEGVNEKTYSALELSYNWLESDETKQLFLLSAVVNAFHVEYLLKVAMGNTSVWIQMHDIVREVAISIASRDQHVFVGKPKAELKEWPTKDFLKSSNRSLEIPDTFFEGMGSLKVLDLSCLNLSSLPTSFRYLTDLQTLCLYHCILENMDAIGALKKLKILTLCKSSMIKLPSEIGTLTNLRMLDLSGSRIEVIPPNIISSLTKLEELYMGYTSVKWEDENSAKQSENASLSELRQLSNLTALQLQIREAWILPRDMKLVFEKLQRFKIVIGDVWEWYDNKDQTLKALKLKLGTNVHLEHEIKALIKGVENLCLDKVHDIQNVLYREGFPLLKHLHIQNNTEMKHIVDYSLVRKNHIQQVSFLNLETLKLVNLQNLEEICHGTLAVNSFSKLRVIKVQNCNQLKYLLSILMVKGLSQLSEIQVSRCNSMETIVLGDGDITTDKIEFFSLHSLTLQHLQAVDHFFSHELMSPCVPLPLFSAQVCLLDAYLDTNDTILNL